MHTTYVNQMYENGVPENVIQEGQVTGYGKIVFPDPQQDPQ